MLRLFKAIFSKPAAAKSNTDSVPAHSLAVTKQVAKEINAINALFDSLGIDGFVDVGNSIVSAAGNFVQYKVVLNNDGHWNKVTALTNRMTGLISECREALVQGQEVLASISNTRLTIEAPYPGKVTPLKWEDAPLDKVKKGEVLLGRSYNGKYVKDYILNLQDSISPHILLGATTGGGKSVEIYNICMSAAYAMSPAELRIVVIDPKGSLHALSGLPHTVVCSDMDEAGGLLTALVLELERRNKEHLKFGQCPMILLAIDELADLMATHGEEVSVALQRLLQMGRERVIHVIGATQHPLSDTLGPIVKANFPVRIGGRVTSETASRVIFDQAGVGADALGGRGSFYVKCANVQRIQTYFISDDNCGPVVKRINEKYADVQPASVSFLAIGSQAVARNQAEVDAGLILQEFALAYLFDLEVPGTTAAMPLRYGVQAKVIRHLEGDDTHTGGGPRTRAMRALRILYAQHLESQVKGSVEGEEEDGSNSEER